MLGDQHVRNHAGDPAQQAPNVVIDTVQGDGHDTHLVPAVQEGDVDTHTVAERYLDRMGVQECPAGV